MSAALANICLATTQSNNKGHFQEILEKEVELEAVLECLDSSKLKCVHNCTHKTALNLAGNAEEHAKQHLKIGTILLKQGEMMNLKYIFTNVDN
jgi:hypothetical protein